MASGLAMLAMAPPLASSGSGRGLAMASLLAMASGQAMELPRPARLLPVTMLLFGLPARRLGLAMQRQAPSGLLLLGRLLRCLLVLARGVGLARRRLLALVLHL